MCGNLELGSIPERGESSVLEHYIYSSSPTNSFSDQDLQEMLISFRTHNAHVQITGMLLYGENIFLQLFEGPGPIAEDLMLRIQRDPRHEKIQLLSSGPIPERLFPNWSMGFQTLADSPLRLHAGYSSVLNQCLHSWRSTATDDGSASAAIHVPSWELLMMFREMVRPNF